MLAICTSGRCPCNNWPHDRFLGVQNAQIWARPLHIAGRAIGGQIGGYARGYHDLFALLAPW